MIEREIKKLELQNGLVPFDEWFDFLCDRRMQAAVGARLARVRAGNLAIANPSVAGCLNYGSVLVLDSAFITGCTVKKSSS
jgi:hypothetical protein